MTDKNVLQEKSYAFALRIVKTHHYLSGEKREYTLSKQLLRAGTSIGANVEEALGGRSDKDFSYKLSIAYKEARETHYWIRLLRDSNYLTVGQADSLLVDTDERLRILGSILKTMKSRNQSNE
jgi:four helix bundle protein